MYRRVSQLSRMAVTVTACLGVAITAFGQVRPASFYFAIGTQSMSAALREYARISGQEIIFTEEVVAGIESAPLNGNYTAMGALTRLLTGSDLMIERSPSGALMIRAVQRIPTADRSPP